MKVLTDVVYTFYYEGRPAPTKQTLSRGDIREMLWMNAGNVFRQLYYTSRGVKDGYEFDLISGMLGIKRFDLSDADQMGKRRADMSNSEVMRMPKNTHIVNIYPVGACSGHGDGIMEITLVTTGEERFYAGNPDFISFKFGVQKGRGIDTYNLPPCISQIDVETSYRSGDTDIPLDIAFDIANQTIGLSLKVKGFPVKVVDNPYDPNAVELRKRLVDESQGQ